MKSKSCQRCGEEKPLGDYHKNKQIRDGHHTICKICNGIKAREWKKSNPERVKDTDYLRTYGISFKDFGDLLSAQLNRCVICGTASEDCPRQTLFIDHCHKTGKVRGLLCLHCNTAIGMFKDSPDVCIRAAAYLTKE